MTILRTVCPNCDIIRVRAPEVTLRQFEDAQHVEVAFRCPGCAGRVVQELSVNMVPMLLSAGCLVITGSGGFADDGGITETEIRDFVASLDREDWFDELNA